MSTTLQTSAQHILDNSRYNVQKTNINVNTDVELLIKAEVFKKQIRIKDFFVDFDRLRRGVVTQDKFRTALSNLNMHMKESDISELVNRYVVGPDQIKYTDFCKQIDSQFFDYSLAQSNLETTKSSSQINEAEQSIINQILLKVKNRIRQKRILLKQPFQDFDRTRCSHITVDQFSRVLTGLGLLPPEPYFSLLVRRYIDNGNVKEINYVVFCDDVDNVSEMLETVIKGIQAVEKNRDPMQDIVTNTNELKLMSTLYTSKKLPDLNKDIDEVEKKIQAEVVMKRLRTKEFFKDYDPLRKGTISESQFKRVLHVSNINISQKEIEAIIAKYKMDNIPNGMVHYGNFCENIDKIFTTKSIDKDPLAVVDQFSENTTLPSRRRYLELTEKEKQRLNELLSLYHTEIQNKRVLIKPHFEDFDITKQGYISKNQFLRILNQFKIFPKEDDLNVILKRYTDKGTLDEVNYYEFCRDVDIYTEGVQVSQDYADSFKNYVKNDHITQCTIYNDKPNDVSDLLSRLRSKAKKSGLRLQEFLRDFDKLRSGNITKNQLRLGMNMCNLPLSEDEFLLLTNYFISEKENSVRWREICNAIDEVFTTKNLEKKSASDAILPCNIKYLYGKKELTQEEIDEAERLKQKFAFFCKATRMDIKQFFQDWDRNARNRISPKQFRQVLATVKFPMSDSEFNAIIRSYATEDLKDVRYVDFINDTKVYDNPFFNPHVEVPGAIKSHIDRREVHINVLLEEIRNHVKINRLRLGEYFKDFDTLRKGTIPRNKFRGVMSQMNIDLPDESLTKLEEQYHVEEDSSIKFHYDNFLNDINIVFTSQGLDKDPLAKPQVYEKNTFTDPRDGLTEYEEKELDLIMTRLGEVVRKHRIMFKTHFQDKDRAKSGKVSFTRFRSILDFHKLPLTDIQYKVLCKRFAHQRVEFNYVEFDELLKKYETAS